MPGATPNRAYPYPLPADPTNVPGDLQALAEAVNDDVQANLAPVVSVPRAIGHMRSSGVQSVPSNTVTPLRFQIVFRDTDNMVDTVSAPTIITVNTPGFYMFHALIRVPTTNWTNVVMRMLLNNVTEVFVTDQEFSSGAQTFFDYTASWMHPMVAGDTMTVAFQHNASGPMSIATREFYGMRMAA